jgi:hypothetical protein
MIIEIEIEDNTDKARNIFRFLDQNNIKYNPKN